MQSKNRKINKKELDLWKHVTKNDIKIGEYTKEYTVNSSSKVKKIIVNPNISKNKTEVKKTNFIEGDIQVNKRMKAKIERGQIRPERQLDLHGNSLTQAKSILFDFIKAGIKDNIRCILIITGKRKTINGSKGLIRENLPLWLKEKELSNLVLFHCYASKKDGDDGARYIFLRKKNRVFYE